MPDGKCECCNKNPSVGVAACPGVPVSIAWCAKCLAADVVPMWVAEFWRDMSDGQEDQVADWAHELIDNTLVYFDVVDITHDPNADRKAWWAAWQPIPDPD